MKNFASTFAFIASFATALAPFSQNSKDDLCSGSGHAQPGQSKPSCWFTILSVFIVFDSPIFFSDCFALEMIAGIPAAVVFAFPSFRGMSSIGVLPFTN